MFPALKRPYKLQNPLSTIQRISDILERNGILPNIVFSGNPYPGVYSMSVKLDDARGGFQAHGKGSTYNYSHASAIAEFIERIQNGFYAQYSRVIQNKIAHEVGFYYFPDEKIISKKEVLALSEAVLDDIVPHSGEGRKAYLDAYFHRLEENGQSGVVSVPFYDVTHDSLQYIPLNLLLLGIGSNGMAAGNTIIEAIFQGICEITERWAGAEIFHGLLTPPTISRDILQEYNEEFHAIEEIEKNGDYLVEIKDFSAGKNIPVVGIIIYDTKKEKYRLNIGSDTSFQIALSRCISEIHQGIADSDQFKASMLTVPKVLDQIFLDDSYIAQEKRERQYALFSKDNSGAFPSTLFGENPSYQVDSKTFTTCATYEEDVLRLISWFKANGRTVYIRDASFLGFPTVWVYVPEISVKGKKNMPLNEKDSDFNITEHDRILMTYFRFASLSDDEIADVAKVLSRFSPDMKIEDAFRTELTEESPYKGITTGFLLTLLWYYLGDIEKAEFFFDQFMKKEDNRILYNRIVHKYLQLKKENSSEIDIRKVLLLEKYDSEVVDEVLHDLRNPKLIFQYMKFPVCPECSICALSVDCLTKYRMEISKRLHNEFKKNAIDQRYISEIFQKMCSNV